MFNWTILIFLHWKRWGADSFWNTNDPNGGVPRKLNFANNQMDKKLFSSDSSEKILL